MDYVTVKWLHILSSTILFGTGIGSAFYLLVSSLGKDARTVAAVAKYVVIADWLFTATTAIIQPATGFYMVFMVGMPVNSKWIMWSTVLYAVALCCWFPVVWLQMKLRNLARQAADDHIGLPLEYWRYFKMWVVLGIPAFFAFIAIFYLMVAKPQ
jgi:uncharacterized membrane protein